MEEGKVQPRTPNPRQAESLVEKASKRLDYVKERELTDQNTDLVLEDAYECMREAIEAFLVLDGYKSYNHEATVVYAFEELDMGYDRTNRLNKFRKLRNDSKYRGEDVEKQEAKDVLELAEKLVPQLKQKFEEDQDD